MADSVILVPGLGLGGAEMFFLARRLQRRGYQVTMFRHCPWCGTLTDKAKALQQLVTSMDSPVVHLIGHSMGGLIILQALAGHSHLCTGRVVLLGSPVNGSTAARRVQRVPLGKLFLGKCMTTACRELPLPIPENRDVGSIAGRINLGIGWILWLPRPNDSVVAVRETQRPEMRDTSVLAASHLSMLLSSRVARQVDSFLQTGTFATDSSR